MLVFTVIFSGFVSTIISVNNVLVHSLKERINQIYKKYFLALIAQNRFLKRLKGNFALLIKN